MTDTSRLGSLVSIHPIRSEPIPCTGHRDTDAVWMLLITGQTPTLLCRICFEDLIRAIDDVTGVTT